MPEAIPDFTEAEREAFGTRRPRRTPQPTPIERADAGMSLESGSVETTLCPTLLRVNVPLVPAVARTAAEGTGVAG